MKIEELREIVNLIDKRDVIIKNIKILPIHYADISWQEGSPAYTMKIPLDKDSLKAIRDHFHNKIKEIEQTLASKGIELDEK